MRRLISNHGRGYKAFLSYVLVTPARNESAFIEKTLKSIIAQTVLPMKWVIVSDGSTDGTDEIVKKYCKQYEWIELLVLPDRKIRDFSAKVNAFNAGYQRVKDFKYDIIGNIDADISFESNHIEFLLEKFSAYPTLGVAGTAYFENKGEVYNYDIVSAEDVSGGCQLFRRECFAEIGGYVPIPVGGEDSVATYAAREKGWMTRTFTEKAFFHYREVGTAQDSLLVSQFKCGKMDYYLGVHPLWEIFRVFYQLKNKPYLLGGVIIFFGYLSTIMKGEKRPISPELVAFRRREQMKRLQTIAKTFLIKLSQRFAKVSASDSGEAKNRLF